MAIESILQFKELLNQPRSPELIAEIEREWRSTPWLRDWCCQQNNPSVEELIEVFVLVLASGCLTVIQEMWNRHPLLRQWVSGEATNFDAWDGDNPDIRIISPKDVIVCFQLAWEIGCDEVIDTIWFGNKKFLYDCFRGQLINFGTGSEPDYQTILPQRTIRYFEMALMRGKVDIVNILYKKCPLLRDWVGSHPVYFPSETATIPPDDLFKYFKKALSTPGLNPAIARAMWDNSSQLQQKFSGSPQTFPLQQLFSLF